MYWEFSEFCSENWKTIQETENRFSQDCADMQENFKNDTGCLEKATLVLHCGAQKHWLCGPISIELAGTKPFSLQFISAASAVYFPLDFFIFLTWNYGTKQEAFTIRWNFVA